MATLAEAIDAMVLTQMLEYAWCLGSCDDATAGAGGYVPPAGSSSGEGLESGPNALFRACALVLYLTGWLTKLAYGTSVASFALVSFKASAVGRFAFLDFSMICVGIFLLYATPGLIAFTISGSFSYSCDGVG
ncbi:hypothetical protein [Oceaniglobus indicus]|uniref:hypothetical protein n=1 Tax=Oceaniglobus indicus TaxID=2047749 RepID=UPI000C17966E|nr:hypothetical protein [Oceaniglobus indicus]